MPKAKSAVKDKYLWCMSLAFLAVSVIVEVVLLATYTHGQALWVSSQMWQWAQVASAVAFTILIVVQLATKWHWLHSRNKAKKQKMPKGSLLVCVVTIAGLGFVALTLALPLPAGLIPPEIATHSNDWPAANQNLSNTRSAKNSSIKKSNTSQLGLAWSLPIQGVSEWGSAATNPLILGHKAYFQDLKSNVYAVDLKTGKQLWMKQYNQDNAGPNGVAIGYGKIFAARGHYGIVALDMNGNEKWSVNLSNYKNSGVDIQLSVFNNKLYVSTVPGVSNSNFYKGGSYGVIYALNPDTGKIIWDFNTVGSADLWGNSSVNSGGGAWYPPAFDPSTAKTFWGIGNAGPWPGTAEFPNGSSRPGADLYTSSIVSLDSKNGKLAWYNQVAPHDLFDYDFQISPILSKVTISNTKRDVVIGAGKMGKVVAFDRKTGKTLWSTEVGTHMNDSLSALPPGVTEVAPGPLGGVETVMAYANDGKIYVPYVHSPVKYTPSGLIADSFNLAAATGGLAAIDATTGKILWDVKLDSMDVGGATVVNDLVFTSTYNGKIYAFDRANGTVAWSYQASGNINGWPAVSGDTILFPVGVGKPPQLLAFRIGAGGTPTSPATNPVPDAGKNFKQ